MKMWLIAGGIACIFVFAVIYGQILTRRFISLFFPDMGRWSRRISWVIGVVLAISSANIFSAFGVFVLHVLAFAFAMDILNLAVKFFAKNRSTAVWDKVFKACAVPIVCAAVVFGYGYANIRTVVRTAYSAQTDKNISSNYRVVFISDIHYGTIFDDSDAKSLVKRVNGENADIIILGGDIVDESTDNDEMKEAFSEFGKMKAKYGIYYVFGNHDIQNYKRYPEFSEAELRAAIERNEIEILEDEYKEINADLIIAGRSDYSRQREELSEVLSGADRDKYIIVADHQPVEYDSAEENGADMVISGHTHAGQVFPVGLIIRFLRTADLYYGHERFGKTDAIVSSGAAGWGYPIRTEKHSEYVVADIEVKK